ncbi:MAG: hypothetical protein U9R05_02620 [Chloroflexota bacterium]|nr:hypothetical protein [Chloroflexota bacterium]
MSKTMDIHIDRSLAYTADGWAERHEVYIQLHHDLLDSGLLATLEGNALKVFLALALQATILTQGNFFNYLAGLGLVTAADLGQVICYQSQETLAKQTGLNRHTIPNQLERLQEQGLVTRHIQRRSQDGRYTRPVFFLHAEHFVSAPHRVKKPYTVDEDNLDRGIKPATVDEENPDRGTKPATVDEENLDRGTKPAMVDEENLDRGTKPATVTGEKKPDRGTKPASSNAVIAVAVGNTRQQQQPAKPQPSGKKLATGQAEVPEANPEATVFAVFAAALGRPYRPTSRDRQHLRTLLADGHTVQTVCALLPGIVARAYARGTQPRTFGYCVPALQEQGRQPLPASPAAPATTSPSVPDLPADIQHDLSALGWAGAPDEVARHYHLDPDRVTALLKHWLHHQDQTIRSRAALFRTDLRAGNWPPEDTTTIAAAENGRRYIEGPYAAFIQH